MDLNRQAYRVALRDIAEHMRTLGIPHPGGGEKWHVTPHEIFNRETRMLNRELGLHRINKQWYRGKGYANSITGKRRKHIQMEQNEQFTDLLNAVKKYSDDVRLPYKSCFATGTIGKFVFRLFQDSDGAHLCVKDEESKGFMWRALYDEEELDGWASRHDVKPKKK